MHVHVIYHEHALGVAGLASPCVWHSSSYYTPPPPPSPSPSPLPSPPLLPPPPPPPPPPPSCQMEAVESGRVDTLFRGNTIACKVLSCSFKTFGLYYLQSVVRPLILHLLKQVDKDYEVDPSRMSDPSKLAENQANLLELVQTFCNTIVNSLPSVPMQLRTVCHVLYSVNAY